jgi:hypothetical protein
MVEITPNLVAELVSHQTCTLEVLGPVPGYIYFERLLNCHSLTLPILFVYSIFTIYILYRMDVLFFQRIYIEYRTKEHLTKNKGNNNNIHNKFSPKRIS